MPEPDLEFIKKYIVRNPYTGGFQLDTEAMERDPAYMRLLGGAWDRGYNSGFDDGVADSTVETQSVNPYK